MLVVVEYRDIQSFLELCFDLEAAGSGDVFQVYSTEAVGNKFDGSNYLVGVLALNAERECVNAAEFLEKAALSLHYGHSRKTTDVAKTQHSRAVGDDCNEIAAARQLVGKVGVLCDLKAGLRNAGGIRKGEILAGVDGRAGYYLDFSTPFIVLL
ncbi:uncharacterized protein BN782_00124 [Eubacterium sp. CAG:786]|nr:uncharacterized protein BN782_00124 [Eubacterium sp. CAG:786]